jgi:hypothetical protein
MSGRLDGHRRAISRLRFSSAFEGHGRADGTNGVRRPSTIRSTKRSPHIAQLRVRATRKEPPRSALLWQLLCSRALPSACALSSLGRKDSAANGPKPEFSHMQHLRQLSRVLLTLCRTLRVTVAARCVVIAVQRFRPMKELTSLSRRRRTFPLMEANLPLRARFVNGAQAHPNPAADHFAFEFRERIGDLE